MPHGLPQPALFVPAILIVDDVALDLIVDDVASEAMALDLLKADCGLGEGCGRRHLVRVARPVGIGTFGECVARDIEPFKPPQTGMH